MSNFIYVVSKKPISTNYVPPALKGSLPLVNQYEVIKRTAKGYRLKVWSAADKGSMYLDEHYSFFESYSEALEYIALEANRVAGEFSETKFVNCPECFGDDECETCDGSGRIEMTAPVTWTTIKEIWDKGVEHFAAAPQEVKS